MCNAFVIVNCEQLKINSSMFEMTKIYITITKIMKITKFMHYVNSSGLLSFDTFYLKSTHTFILIHFSQWWKSILSKNNNFEVIERRLGNIFNLQYFVLLMTLIALVIFL